MRLNGGTTRRGCSKTKKGEERKKRSKRRAEAEPPREYPHRVIYRKTREKKTPSQSVARQPHPRRGTVGCLATTSLESSRVLQEGRVLHLGRVLDAGRSTVPPLPPP